MNIFQKLFDTLGRKFDSMATVKPTPKLESLDSQSLINAINSLNERIDAMAVSLDGLSEQIERNRILTTDAIGLIDKLSTDVKSISDELAVVKVAAESSVDATRLEELIAKLRSSTDALEGTLKK